MKITIILIMSFLIASCSQSSTKQESHNRHIVVVDVEITDLKKYDKFIELEIPILEKHGAFIAMDIRSKDQKKRYIIVSFPSRESVTGFVKSEEFKKILPLNKESSKSTIFHGSDT